MEIQNFLTDLVHAWVMIALKTISFQEQCWCVLGNPVDFSALLTPQSCFFRFSNGFCYHQILMLKATLTMWASQHMNHI